MATVTGTDLRLSKVRMKRTGSKELISNSFGFSKNSEKNVAHPTNDNISAPERISRRVAFNNVTFIYMMMQPHAAHHFPKNSIKYNFYNYNTVTAKGEYPERYAEILNPIHYVNAAL